MICEDTRIFTKKLSDFQLYDFEPAVVAMQQEVLEGLRQKPKQISAKFNYDGEGAKLYERLCQAVDYYLTRTETALMQKSIGEIAAYFSEGIVLIEYGSGNSQKTRLLFEHLPNLIAYIPVDISKQQLLETSQAIALDYPTLEVLPVCADYTQDFDFPSPTRPAARRLIYYPGSTIGNIPPAEAVHFLQQVRQHCEPGDGLLIGIDLQKDATILTRAYSDSDGISEQFNLINPIRRFNRELGANFVLSQYQHYVRYNDVASCVEIYWKSLYDQTVAIQGEVIHLNAGELIDRAVAYKYTLSTFQALTMQAGWQTKKVWTDERQWFSVQYLCAADLPQSSTQRPK